MREPVTIQTIYPQDALGMAKVAEFGASFQHEIKLPHLPVHVLCRGGKWVGFFQRMQMIVSLPAWHTHPDICSPRDVLEGGRLLAEAAKFADGACVVEVDPDGNFTPEIMEKLGFVPRKAVLYQKP